MGRRIPAKLLYLLGFTSMILILLTFQRTKHHLTLVKKYQTCKAKEKMDKLNAFFKEANIPNEHSTVIRKTFMITWFEVPLYVQRRPLALSRGFDSCEFNNCVITDEKSCLEKSDAVIFKGAHLPEKYPFKRPHGQVWIFAEDESPFYYNDFGGHYKNNFWKSAFNWTMTYNRNNTDIYLPNGEIWKRKTEDNRDFQKIAKSKTKDAVIITSRCKTDSKRELVIEKLKKYINVDILGRCGQEWKCGTMYVHDDCFNILNYSYKFYLAFENALCRGYSTEKFFENFNYDLLLVSRAGKTNFREALTIPENVYIDSNDYQSIDDLGAYLQRLVVNNEEYAGILRRKSQYYFPGFQEVYQRALCKICERMNLQEEYRQQIADLKPWLMSDKPCAHSEDIEIS
ncbi:glycoprotein 3-alpha-L-fucosyltransferase A-like [Mercenaria mercenaria]|uniref:glycoprotein 3-alpha-L-fucosyltransferase A-like n=1 Tax=Mercenaria mercenaria TaxID=6596 RepID=UPI001E1DD9A0|nr:glycoprotein 3-alpha-L-fucosyltransferase A-like [Mercenaria mercenaria]